MLSAPHGGGHRLPPQQAHDELKSRGVAVSDVQEFDWGKFVFFTDPDGNKCAVQELPPRA
jgi:hypothetical protein